MKLAYYAVSLALIIFLLAFVTVSSSADSPAPLQINCTANPYLDTTVGLYSMNLTVYVYDDSGNPAVDGTVVDFSINAPAMTFNGSIPTNYTRQYYPILNGNLNGNNSQYAFIPTRNGKAVARYGWFPDNQIPYGVVRITAALNNTPSVKMTYDLVFNGTTQVQVMLELPMIDVSPPPWIPISSATPTATPTATQTSTPLSPMITLISLTIGATIVLAVRRK